MSGDPSGLQKLFASSSCIHLLQNLYPMTQWIFSPVFQHKGQVVTSAPQTTNVENKGLTFAASVVTMP